MKRAYTYEDLGKLKNQILSICEDVKRLNPEAWKNAHDGTFSDESRRFNDLCVQALRKVNIYAGMNGKRGDQNSRSDDILAFGLVAGEGGAADKGGTFSEMAIIDFIIDAGGDNPSIGWIDQSKAAPGIFLDPEGLPADASEHVPQPPVQTPPSPNPQPPAVSVGEGVGALLASLDGVQRRLDAIERDLSGKATSAELHALVGNEIVPHLDDLKRIALGMEREERFR